MKGGRRISRLVLFDSKEKKLLSRSSTAEKDRSPLFSTVRKILHKPKPSNNTEKLMTHAFSLNESVLKDIFDRAKPLGHHENAGNLNLGFGFLYYGLVRSLRPKHVVIIGSGFGFSVVCLGLGVKDNGVGRVSFVDPSYSLLRDGPFKTVGGNGKWDDPERVRTHFGRFGVDGIVSHYRMISEEFFRGYEEFELPPIDLAFIDGNHSFKNVRSDFLEVLERSHKNTYVFLHDSNIYVRELLRHSGVKRWLKILKKKKELFEIINFPFASGVALVRIVKDGIKEVGA
jgi:hypothetical protein